jgi:hypothetical protein
MELLPESGHAVFDESGRTMIVHFGYKTYLDQIAQRDQIEPNNAREIPSGQTDDPLPCSVDDPQSH